MSIHGFGLGASVVGGFSDAHKSAIKAGFPDTIDTYGLVSGLWTSVFAFGAFVGEREHNIWIRLLHLSVQVLLLVAFSLMQWLSDGPSSSSSLPSWSLWWCWSATSASSCVGQAPQALLHQSLQTQTRSTKYFSHKSSSHKDHHWRIVCEQVPSLPTIGEGYGTTSPTIGTRMRKYSESVGRSYVASSVARWIKHWKCKQKIHPSRWTKHLKMVFPCALPHVRSDLLFI